MVRIGGQAAALEVPLTRVSGLQRVYGVAASPAVCTVASLVCVCSLPIDVLPHRFLELFFGPELRHFSRRVTYCSGLKVVYPPAAIIDVFLTETMTPDLNLGGKTIYIFA